MQRWFVVLAMTCGISMLLAADVGAQVKVQAKAKAQVQIQAQPAQLLGDVKVMPNVGVGRLAQADAVLVGRVVAIEPMDVEASL